MLESFDRATAEVNAAEPVVRIVDSWVSGPKPRVDQQKRRAALAKRKRIWSQLERYIRDQLQTGNLAAVGRRHMPDGPLVDISADWKSMRLNPLNETVSWRGKPLYFGVRIRRPELSAQTVTARNEFAADRWLREICGDEGAATRNKGFYIEQMIDFTGVSRKGAERVWKKVMGDYPDFMKPGPKPLDRRTN